MKKYLRVGLVAAILMTTGSMNVFGSIAGTDPRPKPVGHMSASLAISVVLSVLGL